MHSRIYNFGVTDKIMDMANWAFFQSGLDFFKLEKYINSIPWLNLQLGVSIDCQGKNAKKHSIVNRSKFLKFGCLRLYHKSVTPLKNLDYKEAWKILAGVVSQGAMNNKMAIKQMDEALQSDGGGGLF